MATITQAELESIIQEIKKKLNIIPIFAKLGDSDDLSNATVQEPGRKGYVRVRLENDDVAYRVVKCGVLGAYTPSPGMGVILHYDEKGDLAIKSADFDATLQAGINPEIFNSGDPRISAFQQTDGLLPLLSGAVSSGGGPGTQTNEVFVEPFRFVDKDNQVRWFTGQLLDLSAYIPIAGEHCYAALFMKISDLSIEVTTSTAKASITPLTEADKQECYDGRSDNTIPVFLYRLHDAQTVVTNADRKEDLRPWLREDSALAIALETKNERGFNLSDSASLGDLSFDDGTLTLTHSVQGGETEFSYLYCGVKKTFTTSQTVTITDTEGLWYIHYDNSGVLTASQTPWAYDDDIVMVAVIYWDATNNSGLVVGDERHGISMGWSTHEYLHDTIGSAWQSGFLPSLTVDGDGSSDSHCEMQAISAGIFHDEDIEHSNAQQTTYELWYKDGAGGDWRKEAASAALVAITATRPDFNEYTGGAWQRTEVTNTNFTLTHIFATNRNGTTNKVILIMGENEYATKGVAQDAALTELLAITTAGLQTPELMPIGTVIIECKDSYTNSYNARAVSTSDGSDFVDFRRNNKMLSGTGGGTSATFLDLTDTPASYSSQAGESVRVNSGETALEFFTAVHADGISGGQTIYGGTDASDDINIYSTSNATKGDIALGGYATVNTDGVTLASGASVNEFSTDGTMAGDSDDAVPTEKAVKAYVDNAVAGVSSGGWTAYSAVTPTRASADDPTYVLTFAAADLTGIISIGMKLKWTQNSTVRYGICTAISFSTNTTLTLYGGTDYDVEDTGTYPISDFYYSTSKEPLSFPLDKSKWMLEVTDTTDRSQATPSLGTWYNLGSVSMDIHIGSWDVSYRVVVGASDTSATNTGAYATLSTANNSESDSDFTAVMFMQVPSGTINFGGTVGKDKPLVLSSKTTYYVNTSPLYAGLGAIFNYNSAGSKLIIRAVCNYL